MTCTCTAAINLDRTRSDYAAANGNVARRVIICAGTGCVSSGALAVRDAFVAAITAAGLPVTTRLSDVPPAGTTHVSPSGCQGFCQMGPLVTVLPDGILYTRVKPVDVAEIVTTTLVGHQPLERLLYRDPRRGTVCRGQGDIPFYTQQPRLVLKDCGVIDPEDLREYIFRDGYRQARRAWTAMEPEQVCQAVSASGLRGRGGGGFPTGRKWDLTRQQPGPRKFIICNADEGDPGAFMNRSVMEGDPHAVIEGMLIAARAIGADAGVIYVRLEYPLAVARVRRAVADAEDAGLLGDDVFGSGQGFRIEVMEGAGAFVCGEETALIASVEGGRGMPRPKPPFPAQSGLWGKPTCINNVETLAAVPRILAMGPEKYRALGTAGSPGTKTFALTGHVVNTGLIEVPFGATLRHIIFDIGGGVTDGDRVLGPEGFKAVQIGGPSGGCLTVRHLDLPLDYDSLKGVGAMVGSGGMVVMNQRTCMVEVARFFMGFTQVESCGKCVPCREGTRQMLALLEDIVAGRGTSATLALLERLAGTVQFGSLCGLGKTAPNPILSTLRHFRDECLAHVVDKRCPTRTCKALSPPVIDGALCKGCGACLKPCPAGAIIGERKRTHRIDAGRCIRCGACISACKFKAIA